VIAVVDHGPGIPPDRHAQVFTAFERLSDHRGPYGAGVGLGLATARARTEAIGGRLELSETPGGGATRITLPAGD
jgi:two-component system, OmpR family, sensor histidine kinase KdpD